MPAVLIHTVNDRMHPWRGGGEKKGKRARKGVRKREEGAREVSVEKGRQSSKKMGGHVLIMY